LQNTLAAQPRNNTLQMMDTQEFYIRQTSENEARGPYNLEQLISLSEIGSLTSETLFYDASREKWTPIRENADLKRSIFPEKTKLSLKAKSDHTWLDQSKSDSTPEITIEEMMDQAEGRTDETKHRLSRKIQDAHNATFGMYAIIAMLVISAAAEILPSVDVIMSLSLSRLIEQPLIVLGGLDLLFALFIYLGTVEIYPLIRARAACGIGLFGSIFFLQAHYGLLLAAIAGSIGLYLSAVLVAPKRAQLSYATGLIGLGCVAWHFLYN
jgi:hypothetical protein